MTNAKDAEPLSRFSDAEMVRRLWAVRTELERRQLDAIAVTYKLHAEYLTGTWGSQFWVAPVVVPASGDPVFVVREFDERRVRLESRVTSVISYFDREHAIAAWADALTAMGLARARIGLELDNLDLTHRDVVDLQARLPELSVVNASDMLPSVMAVKSSEEIATMRVAAERTRFAIETFVGSLAEGAVEADVRRLMEAAVTSAGSENLRGNVAFGPSTAIPHGGNGRTPLKRNDAAFTECSGYHLGYCATLCRTAVLGRNAAVEKLYNVARSAVDAIEAALRPGVTAGEVDRACRSVVEDAGSGGAFRHRSGYSIGLRATGRLSISLKPGAPERIEEGMTFHTPIILIDEGIGGIGCSETFLVTKDGAEPLVGVARNLILL